MPLTESHVAAAIPFARGNLVPSALVAGTMAPDLEGYLPWHPIPVLSHSWTGVLTTDLAVGLLVLMLFQAVLKRPLFASFPSWARCRLVAPASGFRWLPQTLGWSLTSIVLGACTHVLLDDLTHGDVIALSNDQSVGNMSATEFAQNATSALLLVATAWWLWRWFLDAPAAEPVEAEGLSRLSVIAVWGLVGTAAAVRSIPMFATVTSPASFIDTTVSAGLVSIDTSVLVLAAYVVCWYLWRLARLVLPYGGGGGI